MKSVIAVLCTLLGTLAVVLGVVFSMSNTVKHDWILLPLSLTAIALGFKIMMAGLLNQRVVSEKISDKMIEKAKNLFRTAQ